MDFMAKITELRAQKAELLEKANALTDEAEINKLSDQMTGINSSIAAYERLAAESAKNAAPLGGDPAKDPGKNPEAKEDKPLKLFGSLGEQLRAIHAAEVTKVVDSRLTKINDSVTGANESAGADGGFAIQTDFAGQILQSAVQESELLRRVDSYTVSAGSNSAKWLMIDETDVSAAVFGGVQMYWASEGATVADSKPKFKEMKLDLEKMMGFAYATDELLQDAAFMTGFFGTAFGLAADRLLTAGVVSGDGAGKPLGILNSSALVTVEKELDQGADTVLGANLLKMYSRTLTTKRSRLVWLMHPDLEDQLPGLYITLGTGDTKSVWMPEGGISGAQYQTVLGKPIVFDDNCSALGDKGDVLLVDPFEYMLLKKGSVKQDWSMHVAFLTDKQCFRVIFRCNGAPKRSSAVKIKNSSRLRSPYVTLAAR